MTDLFGFLILDFFMNRALNEKYIACEQFITRNININMMWYVCHKANKRSIYLSTDIYIYF